LNLVVWEACVSAEDLRRPEVFHAVMSAFMEYHRGFHLKCLIAQADSVEHMQQMAEAGGRLLSSENGLPETLSIDEAESLVRRPHVFFTDRELALRTPGSWVASLFLREIPKLGFSLGEQKLLVAAQCGSTDEELADELGLSRSAVKKTWRSIYQRVIAHAPALLPGSTAEMFKTERGRAKKHRLLAYLRGHPEELRPHHRA